MPEVLANTSERLGSLEKRKRKNKPVIKIKATDEKKSQLGVFVTDAESNLKLK